MRSNQGAVPYNQFLTPSSEINNCKGRKDRLHIKPCRKYSSNAARLVFFAINISQHLQIGFSHKSSAPVLQELLIIENITRYFNNSPRHYCRPIKSFRYVLRVGLYSQSAKVPLPGSSAKRFKTNMREVPPCLFNTLVFNNRTVVFVILCLRSAAVSHFTTIIIVGLQLPIKLQTPVSKR